MAVVYQPDLVDWKLGLFECFDSIPDCLASFFCCPCYASVAGYTNGQGVIGSCLQCLCYPLGLAYLRPRTRNLVGIRGSIFTDILAALCCPCCTAIQLKREATE